MIDRLLAVKPGDAEAHSNRGFLLQERKRPPGRIAAFERGSPSSDHDRAHYGLAAVC